MDFYVNVKKQEEKLSKALADHNLLFNFSTKKYPAVLTVSQNQDMDAQMEIYSTAEGSVSSKDAALRLIFKLDGIEIQTDSRLVMTDALMSKIKGIAKKMHAEYCAGYFAERRAKGAQETGGETAAPAPAANSGAFDGFYGEADQGDDSGDGED